MSRNTKGREANNYSNLNLSCETAASDRGSLHEQLALWKCGKFVDAQFLDRFWFKRNALIIKGRSALEKQTEFSSTILLFVLIGILTPSAYAQEWSTSGDFKLTARNAFAIKWELPTTKWKSQREFELSVPGQLFELSKMPTTFEGATKLDQLFSLIASVEAPNKQYNAVHLEAKVLPPALPSRLSIQEVIEWIAATPGQHHAIGRYQIIPDTFAYLIEAENIQPTALFDQEMQDRMAERLLKDAGWTKFQRGELSLGAFMDRIARVWAGFPMENGQSAYEGVAGNRAVISRKRFKEAMSAIFPNA